MTSHPAEALFCALDTLDHCLQPPEEAQQIRQTPSFHSLFSYVTQAHAQPPEGVQTLESQVIIKRLLQHHGRFHFPLAAAASSGAILTREVNGLHISLRPSLNAANHVYLILESEEDMIEKPESLFIIQPDTDIIRFALSEFEDGYMQILLTDDHGVVKGLHHHESQVIVR